MKRITKQFDYAIHVLINSSLMVMAIGKNEAWRDDCLSAVKLLRAARRKKKESRPTGLQHAKVSTCGRCAGSGLEKDDYHNCIRCGGTGIV